MHYQLDIRFFYNHEPQVPYSYYSVLQSDYGGGGGGGDGGGFLVCEDLGGSFAD